MLTRLGFSCIHLYVRWSLFHNNITYRYQEPKVHTKINLFFFFFFPTFLHCFNNKIYPFIVRFYNRIEILLHGFITKFIFLVVAFTTKFTFLL